MDTTRNSNAIATTTKSNSRKDGGIGVVVLIGVSAATCIASVGYYWYCCHHHGKATAKRDGANKKKRDRRSGNGAIGDWGKPKSKTTSNDGDDSSSSSSSSPFFELPQHLQRELHKEERRKASVRFLARKTPLYENIEMYAPDGATMLCTIGRKKANWYVRKELAVWLQGRTGGAGGEEKEHENEDKNGNGNETPSIRLLFEPKNHKKKKTDESSPKPASGETGITSCGQNVVDSDHEEQMRKYNCTHKLNICVSCGALDATASAEASGTNANKTDGESLSPPPTQNAAAAAATSTSTTATTGLMRHYVVPYAYRRLLPTKFKTHMPHDVVLLCLDCHIDAEQAAKVLRTDVYEESFRTDPTTRPAVVIDFEAKAIKSKARALWQHKSKLPQSRIDEYENELKRYLAKRTASKEAIYPSIPPITDNHGKGVGDSSILLSEAVLRHLALALEAEKPNPNYVPLASLVVDNLCQTDEDIQEFVVGWRNFFVETLQPRYLPTGWRVDSPVRVDVDPEEVEGCDEKLES